MSWRTHPPADRTDAAFQLHTIDAIPTGETGKARREEITL
jgi:hypothetical protein